MIKEFVRSLWMLVLMLCAAGAAAGAVAEAPSEETQQQIKSAIRQAQADLKIAEVTTSPVPGLYQARIVNGPTIYVTEKGDFFIVGDLYRVEADGLTNVTQASRDDQRKAALDQVSKDEMIVFAPKGDPKAHITVFTDVDCGYCRMLHQEVPALNELGVEVRYMAFPRAGVNSESYRKLARAWCAEDQQETLTTLKQGKSVSAKVCEGNPVAEHYALGQQLGVTATPAIIFASGELQLGYMKAPQLAERLGL